MARVIVAGGATGIGAAAVRGFRARGDDVLLVDSNPAAEHIAAEDAQGRAVFLHRDLADPAVPAEVVAATVDTFGGIDCVLITAAIMRSATLADWTPQMWDETFALNLRMPFFFAQAAAPHLAESHNASILLISSTAALRGNPGAAAYQATKAALPGLMRSLTAELGPAGIRINCILPGWIETPFNNSFWDFQADPAASRAAINARIPIGRQGDAQEVADTILFLASPAARYIAGAEIVVDGGYTAV